jgi:hypothetical protein
MTLNLRPIRRRVLATLLLVLSAPFWVVAMVLVPIYYTERLSYGIVNRCLFGFLAAWRSNPIVEPLDSRQRYFAKSRNARRAHKVVRS